MVRGWFGSKKQKETCLNQFGLCAQNKITLLGSIINGGGEPIMTFDNEYMNLHFDNE